MVASPALLALLREPSPALLRRWIGVSLRQLRREAGKTRPEVAEELGMSKTAIGHMETGRNLPKKPALTMVLNYYGATERLPGFLQLIEAAGKGRNWWETLSKAVPPWFNLFLGLESGASELLIFQSLLVTGLLQTRGYAEAVIRANPDLSDDDVRQRVELRLRRQSILDRPKDPVRLTVVLDEAVLYRQRGGAEVMRGQLDHLLVMSEKPGVDIRILLLDVGAHRAQQNGMFTLMKFPPEVGDPGVVYEELRESGLYREEPYDIALYDQIMSEVLDLAATPEGSRGIIERAMKEVKS